MKSKWHKVNSQRNQDNYSFTQIEFKVSSSEIKVTSRRHQSDIRRWPIASKWAQARPIGSKQVRLKSKWIEKSRLSPPTPTYLLSNFSWHYWCICFIVFSSDADITFAIAPSSGWVQSPWSAVGMVEWVHSPELIWLWYFTNGHLGNGGGMQTLGHGWAMNGYCSCKTESPQAASPIVQDGRQLILGMLPTPGCQPLN